MIRNHGHFVLVGIKRAPEECSFCNTDWWALHSIGKASVHGRCFAVWNRAACSVECIPWTNATQHISCIRLMAWRSPEQQCKTYLQMVGPTPIHSATSGECPSQESISSWSYVFKAWQPSHVYEMANLTIYILQYPTYPALKHGIARRMTRYKTHFECDVLTSRSKTQRSWLPGGK